MAGLGTLEAQGGNGCGKDFADPVESIFCNFGAALTGTTIEVGAEALTGVAKTVKAPISSEQALAFAKAVVAKDIMDTFSDGVRHRQGPLTDYLLPVVATAQQQIINELYGYYKETNEQAMTSLAQAIREQFGKIR